jgi:hypothetical protein
MPATGIVSASVPDTLASLKVNPETGLARAEVDTRRKENGYNEVAEKKDHPVLKFLRKFWGISAWMLELIMVLSAVLGKYSDLVVVGALLVINAVLSFMQESRAAGVVAALRKRLQVNARVLREANWQVIPARELVPGDIVRMRPGDIIPADVKAAMIKWRVPAAVAWRCGGIEWLAQSRCRVPLTPNAANRLPTVYRCDKEKILAASTALINERPVALSC